MGWTIKDGASTVFTFGPGSLPKTPLYLTTRVLRQFPIDGENDTEIEDTNALMRTIRLEGIFSVNGSFSTPGTGTAMEQMAVMRYLIENPASNADFYTLVNSDEKTYDGASISTHPGHSVVFGPQITFTLASPNQVDFLIDFTISDDVTQV